MLIGKKARCRSDDPFGQHDNGLERHFGGQAGRGPGPSRPHGHLADAVRFFLGVLVFEAQGHTEDRYILDHPSTEFKWRSIQIRKLFGFSFNDGNLRLAHGKRLGAPKRAQTLSAGSSVR